jgi:hypothetical protein
MKRPLKNEVKLVWVRQECKPPFVSNSCCPIKREKKRNERNAITLEGDLCSHKKGALMGGYVYLNKSWLCAQGQQVAAQEALKKPETEHQEINLKGTSYRSLSDKCHGRAAAYESKAGRL